MGSERMLKGKTVLVTGSSRGIGRETILLCAEKGAEVAINYCHSGEEANELRDEVKDRHGTGAIVIKADVSDEGDVKAMFKEVKAEYGKLDVLVNNAGILKDNLLMLTRPSEYDMIMGVNARGCFLCMQHAAKMMMKTRSGKIINIASIVGRRGNSGQVAYAGSKAAIIGMTYAAAKELGQFGISVNAIAPGLIDTDMITNLSQEDKDGLLSRISLKRIGTPEDVAKGVVLLASDLGAYISGQVIGVDGSMMM